MNYRIDRKRLLDAGFVEAHGSSHIKFKHPSGAMVVRAVSIGGGRGEANWAAEVKRALKRVAAVS